jgi:predicted nucleic-acid-binding protein
MRSLDTNCALRWLLGDVPEQTEAMERLLALGEPFRMADVAVVEVGFALTWHYELTRETAASLLEALIAHPAIVCDQRLWASVLDVWRRSPKLSLADAYLALEAAAPGGGSLLTFDRKLAGQVDGAELVAATTAPGP